MNFQMFNLDLEKAKEPEIKLPTSFWIMKKAREFQKNIYFCFFWLHQSLCLCGSQQTVENSSRDGWEHQTTWPASWDICMQVKKHQLEPDMEQQTGSKSGKE